VKPRSAATADDPVPGMGDLRVHRGPQLESAGQEFIGQRETFLPGAGILELPGDS
jgi:hypothetical protein